MDLLADMGENNKKIHTFIINARVCVCVCVALAYLRLFIYFTGFSGWEPPHK